MNKIGNVATINGNGLNMCHPSKYLNGMCLGHLTPAIEWLYVNEPCVVIGMSEFYPQIMFALKRIEDGKIFVAKISDITFTKIQPQKTTQEQAIESFKMCIEAEIDGCIEGREKGDFLLDCDEVTLAPSLTENREG